LYISVCVNLRTRYEKEAAGKQQSLHCSLHVTELDSIQIQHALTVGKNQSIQRENLEHLKSRHQRTATLFDDVTYYSTHTHTHTHTHDHSHTTH